MTRRIFCLLILCFIALSGCSSITMIRTKEMQAVGNDVKSNMTEQNKIIRAEIDSLRQVLDSLYAMQEQVNNRLRAEVSLLAARVASESERNDSRQEEVLYRLDMLLGKSDKILSKRVVVSGAAEKAPADSSEMAAEKRQELEQIFTTARSDYHRGEYKLAFDGFKQIYEQAKTGDLAENSLYWMGLCLAEAGQMDKAKVVFIRVTEQFPNGGQVCVTLFKLAGIAAAENDVPLQKQYLQQLLGNKTCAESNEFIQSAEMLEAILNQETETIQPAAAATDSTAAAK
ncbi:MAG: tetratricopeptide repeat protein [Fibrobacter sp.]|jgi:TolA-binding protein|nr:tetratricopeptide repeat protein [Fibrobacter sp.]